MCNTEHVTNAGGTLKSFQVESTGQKFSPAFLGSGRVITWFPSCIYIAVFTSKSQQIFISVWIPIMCLKIPSLCDFWEKLDASQKFRHKNLA